MTHDAWNLQRFVDAQAPVYEGVKLELGHGHKRSHWMWFVFPQLAALGSSATAKHYGLHSPAEARAYLAHPLLGHRLRECCAILLGVQGRDAHEIFGYPDDLKFKSCMTLFELAAPQEPVFGECLDKFCDGARDAVTQGLCRPTS
jgi:uncharacterized protein (DUF1810 family)